MMINQFYLSSLAHLGGRCLRQLWRSRYDRYGFVKKTDMDLLPRKRLRAAHGMEGHCVVFRRNLDLELRTCDAIMLIFWKAFSNLCSSHLWVKYCGGHYSIRAAVSVGICGSRNSEKHGITKSEEKHPANGYWAWPYEVVWRASLARHKLPVNEHHGSNTGQEALTRSSHAVNQDVIHTWEQDWTLFWKKGM